MSAEPLLMSTQQPVAELPQLTDSVVSGSRASVSQLQLRCGAASATVLECSGCTADQCSMDGLVGFYEVRLPFY